MTPRTSERAAPSLETLRRYQRAANYLTAAQIYLKDNVLLEQPLRPEHVKDRLLGHWGTCPGLNLVHAHLNRLVLERDASILLVTGPGHGAAATLANLYLDGTLAEHYPAYTLDRAGLARFVRAFSWPGGFPSHLSPLTPGVIHEGGELGYALATAFGAALDNPGLVVACVVGDGEAETGPTATAWHATKFLDPQTSGAVLPILHLNGFKISSPTIAGSMADEELTALFSGYGWEPLVVAGPDYDESLSAALAVAYERILELWGVGSTRARWPMIVLRTPKGLGGPARIAGERVEGSFRSHQVPAKDVKSNPESLAIVEHWLRSYRPEELWDGEGRLVGLDGATPTGDRRVGMNPHAYGGRRRRPLDLPPLERFALGLDGRGSPVSSATEQAARYLQEVVRRSEAGRNFRIVCPDELQSNLLGAVLEATGRAFTWPVSAEDAEASQLQPDGRVMEMLSEHTCQGWLQGYLQTGRHGLFPCYEAFVTIVDSMVHQYGKWLKMSRETSFRTPVSSLNYLLTSDTWRQDHNGYSHQGPGFINTLLTKKGSIVRIYLPPDANTLVSTIDHVLRTTDYINLVIATKQPLPQWLTMEEAIRHCDAGASAWEWAGSGDREHPDVVIAAAGNNPTLEALAAVSILREELSDLAVRFVNVTDLLVLERASDHPHGMDDEAFDALFTERRPVIFNFHGYPSAVHQLVYKRSCPHRFHVRGYVEEGTTTTPFDMHLRNGTSRWHLAIEALRHAPRVASRAQAVVDRYRRKIETHGAYIAEHGVDPPEVTEWRWSSS